MMCALTMPTKEPDKRLSARKHANRVYLISDIHGTLEVLLQFLLQTGLVVKDTAQMPGTKEWFAHVRWNEEVCRHAAVLILGDLTDRVRSGRGHKGEMQLEELRIAITIFHLNATHPDFRDAIATVLGNHDLDNRMRSPISVQFSSTACHDEYNRYYGVHGFEGRRTLFTGVNRRMKRDRKCEIARNVVVFRKWPEQRLYMRDFLPTRCVCMYFPKHELLALHGGLSDFVENMRPDIDKNNPRLHAYNMKEDLFITAKTDIETWVRKMNKLSRLVVRTGMANPAVDSVVRDRGMSSDMTCVPCLGIVRFIAVGHSRQESPNIMCNVIRMDAGNNAQAGCLDTEGKPQTLPQTLRQTLPHPCLYAVRTMVVREEQAIALEVMPPGNTAACMCSRKTYHHLCDECQREPCMWSENDFFTLAL